MTWARMPGVMVVQRRVVASELHKDLNRSDMGPVVQN